LIRRRSGEAGFALIIVLWSLVLVSLLVTQLTADGRLETRRVANGRAQVMEQMAVDGAVEEAVFHLLDQSERHWNANGIVREIRVGGFAVRVSVTNEADKVNPNVAPPELLTALLRRVGVADRDATSLAAAIVGWRTQPGAANELAVAYRPLGYLPPGTPFQTLDELGLVAGMTPDVLARLMPHLQLFRALPPISSTTDPIVTAALADWSGLPTATSGSVPDESFIAITAVAGGPDGARAERRAVIQLDPGAKTLPFHVLDWR
jgi:general secretion pathway protein K